MSKSSSTARPAAKGPNRAPLIAVGLAAVVAVVLVIVAVAGGGGKDPAKAEGGIAQVRDVTVTGDALPPYDSSVTPDPAVGKKPPELAGKSFDGTGVSLVPGGKLKLVVFVAHWCPHCRAEVPRIVQWMKSDAYPKQVDVIAVSTGVQPTSVNYPPSDWLAKEKFTVPTIADSAKATAAQAWGLTGYPYLVLVKSDGTVAARASGEMEIDALNTWVRTNLGIAS